MPKWSNGFFIAAAVFFAISLLNRFQYGEITTISGLLFILGAIQYIWPTVPKLFWGVLFTILFILAICALFIRSVYP